MNFFNRIDTLIFSVVLFFLYIISYFNNKLSLPSFYKDFCCIDDKILNVFLVSIPVLIFSILLIKSNDHKFKSWRKFTVFYLIVYLVIYLLSPTQGDGLLWFQRETISLFGFILYTLFSLFLIIYKSLRKDKNQ